MIRAAVTFAHKGLAVFRLAGRKTSGRQRQMARRTPVKT